MDYDIGNNEAGNRYELEYENHVAVVEYKLMPGKIYFTHTEVPEELEGKGIGSALARFVLNDARQRQLQVIPLCPFINAYIEKHPEYQDLL